MRTVLHSRRRLWSSVYFGAFCTLASVAWFIAFLLHFVLADAFTIGVMETLKGRRALLDDLHLISWPMVISVAEYSLPTGVVAALGWWLIHRLSHDPGWVSYVLLALFVLAVNHVVFLGVPTLGAYKGYRGDGFVLIGSIRFIFIYGWVSVAGTLVATALFVWLNGQRVGAR